MVGVDVSVGSAVFGGVVIGVGGIGGGISCVFSVVCGGVNSQLVVMSGMVLVSLIKCRRGLKSQKLLSVSKF